MKNFVALVTFAVVLVLCYGEQTYQRLQSSYPKGVKWQLNGNVQRKQQTYYDYDNVHMSPYKYEAAMPFEHTYYKKAPIELAVQKSELVGPQYLVPNVAPYMREAPGYQYPVPSQRYQVEYN